MKRKIVALFLVLALCLSMAACGVGTPPNVRPIPTYYTPNQEPSYHIPDEEIAEYGSWAVYWYLCGSNLETENGFATTDLIEMMEV